MAEQWHIRDPAAFRTLEAELRARFPTMHAIVEHGECWVRGTLAVAEGDRYQLEVLLPAAYPRRLPKVWESGERIPRHVDRHVFTDGSLCLGAPLALWLALDGDFSLTRVLGGPVRNFLVGNSFVEEGEPWPHGELLHGDAGLLQQVYEMVGTDYPVDAALMLLAAATKELRGHSPCPCGSGRKLRKCHEHVLSRLSAVPPIYLQDAIYAVAAAAKRELSDMQAASIVRRFMTGAA